MIKGTTSLLKKTLYSSLNTTIVNKGSVNPLKTSHLTYNLAYSFSSDPKNQDPKNNQQGAIMNENQQMNDPSKQEEFDEEEDDVSFSNERKKGIYFFVVAGLGLLGGYSIMEMNTLREEKKTLKTQKVSYTGKADIGGPWQLVDMEGNVVTNKDFKGYYYLMYFGFCNCPDICPVSLQKISKALDNIRKMPEYKYMKIKTIFVSVDPDRDSPEKMRKFLSHFDKSIIGLTSLTNDDPNLKKMMKRFRIYATKIELDENPRDKKKGYTLDHTIITYLMDDNNNYLTHLGSNLSDRDMSSIIVDAVLENEQLKTKGGRLSD